MALYEKSHKLNSYFQILQDLPLGDYLKKLKYLMLISIILERHNRQRFKLRGNNMNEYYVVTSSLRFVGYLTISYCKIDQFCYFSHFLKFIYSNI